MGVSRGNDVSTNQPSTDPSNQPTNHPINHPTNQPSNEPTNHPTNHPPNQPTNQPIDPKQLLVLYFYYWASGAILSDPPWKNGNFRFTVVPLKAVPDQVWIINILFWNQNIVVSLHKCLAHFYSRKTKTNHQNKTFKLRKNYD